MTTTQYGDTRLPARFWSKTEVTNAGCWRWTAATRGGYGIFGLRRASTVSAHRLAYEMLVGPIPEGMQIDHICRNRSCVNPRHLHVVTHRQNSENVTAHRDSASGVRGVWWNPRRKRWVVQVCSAGKKHDGGSHRTLEAAKKSAIKLRNELHTNNLTDGQETA